MVVVVGLSQPQLVPKTITNERLSMDAEGSFNCSCNRRALTNFVALAWPGRGLLFRCSALPSTTYLPVRRRRQTTRAMSLPQSTARPVQSGISSRVTGLKFMQRAAARQSQSQPSSSLSQPGSSTPASPAAAAQSNETPFHTSTSSEEWVLPSAARAIANAREAHSRGKASAKIEYDDQWRSWELDDDDLEEDVPTTSATGQVGRTQFGAQPVKQNKQQYNDDNDDTLEPDLSGSEDDEDDDDLGVHLGSDSEEKEEHERKPASARKTTYQHEDKSAFRKPHVPNSLGTARAVKKGSGLGGSKPMQGQKRSSDSFDASTAASQKRSKQ